MGEVNHNQITDSERKFIRWSNNKNRIPWILVLRNGIRAFHWWWMTQVLSFNNKTPDDYTLP